MGFQELLNHGTREVSALVSPGGHVMAGGALEGNGGGSATPSPDLALGVYVFLLVTPKLYPL